MMISKPKTREFVALAVAMLCAASGFGQPRTQPISEQTLLAGSPLHLALNGTGGEELSFSVESSSELVTARVLEDNRSLRIVVNGFGEMVFELFDGRTRRATNRIVELADGGFYDGLVFHRVIDDFVIQGGDPNGDGTGGSELGAFNDQFHVDLQHNRTGLLSMAKANDDTNNSQFFITEGSARHLDFNHSIFGLLVEGESVRQAISNADVDNQDRPVSQITMETVESFKDARNAVLMLKAPEGETGTVDITVSVRNAGGAGTQQTFRVNVIPDSVNSPPFLKDIPEMKTTVDIPFEFQLEAVDVEGDASFFLDQTSLSANNLPVPVFASPGLSYEVDFNTGAVRVTPSNGLTGGHWVVVATAIDSGAVDYQAVRVQIDP